MQTHATLNFLRITGLATFQLLWADYKQKAKRRGTVLETRAITSRAKKVCRAIGVTQLIKYKREQIPKRRVILKTQDSSYKS